MNQTDPRTPPALRNATPRCIHCNFPIFDNGTVWVHHRISWHRGKLIEMHSQWCDDADRSTMAETTMTLTPVICASCIAEDHWRCSQHCDNGPPCDCPNPHHRSSDAPAEAAAPPVVEGPAATPRQQAVSSWGFSENLVVLPDEPAAAEPPEARDAALNEIFELGKHCVVDITGDPTDAESITNLAVALEAIRHALEMGQERSRDANTAEAKLEQLNAQQTHYRTPRRNQGSNSMSDKRPANYVGNPAENAADKREQLEARANDRREKACEILDAILKLPETTFYRLMGDEKRNHFLNQMQEHRKMYGTRFLVTERELSWLEDIAWEFGLP